MNERQQKLLKLIINQYIKTAQPIGSKFIADLGKFDLSPATIRNEMSELENLGYIYHPHTSAGRVPTEKGYQFLVENLLTDSVINKREQDSLDKIIAFFDKFEFQVTKELAKGITNFTNGAVFVAFSDRDFYYTGLSNLFSQPEFEQHHLVYSLSQVIDHLDNVLGSIFNNIENDVEVYIGSKNPFSKDCSSMITKYKSKDNIGLLGILGPLRTNYENNIGLLKYSQELINNL